MICHSFFILRINFRMKFRFKFSVSHLRISIFFSVKITENLQQILEKRMLVNIKDMLKMHKKYVIQFKTSAQIFNCNDILWFSIIYLTSLIFIYVYIRVKTFYFLSLKILYKRFFSFFINCFCFPFINSIICFGLGKTLR